MKNIIFSEPPRAAYDSLTAREKEVMLAMIYKNKVQIARNIVRWIADFEKKYEGDS